MAILWFVKVNLQLTCKSLIHKSYIKGGDQTFARGYQTFEEMSHQNHQQCGSSFPFKSVGFVILIVTYAAVICMP